MGKETTFVKEMLLRGKKYEDGSRATVPSSFHLIVNHNEPLKFGAKIEDNCRI
jgi:hypothetical protein